MEKTGIAVWDPVEIPQKTVRRCGAFRCAASGWSASRPSGTSSPMPETRQERTPRTACSSRGPRSPTSSEWRHYLHRDSGPMQPSPVLPDRPVVMRPDRALTLLPGQSTIFFLEIPVWFRLSTSGYRPARIFEEPLTVLTRTWFGDPVNGELCWGLATRLHHSIESVEPSRRPRGLPPHDRKRLRDGPGLREDLPPRGEPEHLPRQAAPVDEQPARRVQGARPGHADRDRAHAARASRRAWCRSPRRG